MICLCFTHYFGAIVVAAGAFWDLILSIRLKKRLFWIMPYVFVFLTLFPYLLIAFINKSKRLPVCWSQPPRLIIISVTIAQVAGNKVIF
jgi:hypothetical protein